MKLADFRNLDTGNFGAWPMAVKLTFATLLVILICVAGWYFQIRHQQQSLARVASEEIELRRDFETKQGRVVNLDAYRAQFAEMQEMFRQMVRQLPSRTEMPELLVDISQSALAAGIDTQLFEPGPESAKDFYAEKPISIRMIGDYHQFGDFISRLAALSRVVVLDINNVTPDQTGITRTRGSRFGAAARPGPARRGAGSTPTPSAPAAPGQALRLEGTIRTYRYLDEDEQAAQQEAAEAAAAASRPGTRARQGRR
jgi:type IV pilus assembly protein PilO